MSNSCSKFISSEESAAFIVEYNGDFKKFSKYNTECITLVNPKFAVAYIPVDRINRNSILEFGYSDFPKCYSLLDTSSLDASGITKLATIPTLRMRGEGVLIGFIDTGIDYTNNAFRNADGTTRITSIWDQTIESESYPKNLLYGTEYSKELINQALQSDNPLSIVPSTDDNGHGTFLAGIAAGSKDERNDFRGIAPECELAIVKVRPAKKYIKDFFMINEKKLCYQENDIMLGIKYLVDLARKLNKPISICISMGSNQGAHDGRSSLDDYSSFIANQTGICIVIAAGNEGNRGHHYYGNLSTSKEFDTVELNVAEQETGFSMELWGFAPNTYSIDIYSPSGEYQPRITTFLGGKRDISFIFESTEILIDSKIVEAQTGDPLILFRFKDPAAGIWQFRVYGKGQESIGFHMWLPQEDLIQPRTNFINPNPMTLITSPGNSLTPITVTAYNHTTGSLNLDSSRGYTRIDTIKPEIAAPGYNLYGPSLNPGYLRMSGTSVASAHTAGITALMLEWGIVKRNSIFMKTQDIKKYLIRGARRNPLLIYPNQEWGYGILDIYNLYEKLRG